MKLLKSHFVSNLLIIIILSISSSLYGQGRHVIATPEVDSVCRNTLEYIRLRNMLLQQQGQIELEKLRIEQSIGELQRHHAEIVGEQALIESELAEVNRILDSLTPERPDRPRPKENIINILNERLSFHGSYGLNINQLALSNWAAGGENSATGKAFANFILLDKKKAFEQKLTGSFAFGLSRFGDKRIEKSDDRIDLTYSLSLNSRQRFKFSAVATFNTQFADGYKYPNDSTRISGFFAPAYLTLSIGPTFKSKNENFQIFLSPLAGKVTFVMIQDLADQGSFGVKKGYYDAENQWIPGENIAAAVGVNAIINYKQPIGKSITYTTMLNAFYNYTEKRDDNRLRLDINWENNVNFVITKFLSTVLFVHLKYDHNTTFAVYETINGEEAVIDNVPKLQLKESLGIAFVHKF